MSITRTTGLLAAAASVLALAAPAGALADGPSATDAAAVFEEIAPAPAPTPSLDEDSVPESLGGTPYIDGADTDVTIAPNAEGGVLTTNGEIAIGIDLPDKAAEGERIDSAGFSAFEGDAATTLVEQTPNGVRLATVSDPAADTDQESFRYDLKLPDGAGLELQADGSIKVVSADGEQLALVHTPWAKDEQGQQLPTSYTIDGNAVIQHVDVSDAVGTVVADPYLDWGLGSVRIVWTRVERDRLHRNLAWASVPGSAATGACGLIPHRAAQIACGVFVSYKLADFIHNVNASQRAADCFYLRYTVWGGYFRQGDAGHSRHNCRYS